MRTIVHAFLLMAFLPLSSCELLTGNERAGDAGFSAIAGDNQLKLRNRSGGTVRFRVVEEQTATVLDLNAGPESWPTLAHGRDTVLPYPEIIGYQEGAERAVVFWYRGEQFRTFKVDL